MVQHNNLINVQPQNLIIALHKNLTYVQRNNLTQAGMATPQEKLADSLEALKALQDKNVVAIRASDLTRTHRERLIKNGFLQEVMKGWYIPASPNEDRGETTAWYASFWDFCASYLNERFGNDWCIAPEQSLSLHAGNRTVPAQLLIRSPRGGNKPTNLLHDTSIFDMRAAMPAP